MKKFRRTQRYSTFSTDPGDDDEEGEALVEQGTKSNGKTRKSSKSSMGNGSPRAERRSGGEQAAPSVFVETLSQEEVAASRTRRGIKKLLKNPVRTRKSSKKSAMDSDGDEEKDGVFGLPLDQVAAQTVLADTVPLPAVFRLCLDYIETKGLTTEGLYRVSGQRSKVAELRKLFESGEMRHLFSNMREGYAQDVATVASLLKEYLRELPETILTDALESCFVQAMALTDKAARLEALREALLLLPRCNLLLLAQLTRHLLRVVEHVDQNKMDRRNLLTVFGPTMRLSLELLGLLMEHHDELFAPDTAVPQSAEFGLLMARYESDRLRDSLRASLPPPHSSRQSCEVIVPQAQSERIRAEMRIVEQQLNRHHTEMALCAEKGAAYPDAATEEMWALQRSLTALKRDLKQVDHKEQGDSPPEAHTLDTDDSKEDCSRVALCEILQGLYDELLFQNVELLAVVKRLAQKVDSERAEIEHLRAMAATAVPPSPPSPARRQNQDLGRLRAELAELQEQECLLRSEIGNASQAMVEQRDACRYVRVQLNLLALKLEQQPPRFLRKWVYRCPEAVLPIPPFYEDKAEAPSSALAGLVPGTIDDSESEECSDPMAQIARISQARAREQHEAAAAAGGERVQGGSSVQDELGDDVANMSDLDGFSDGGGDDAGMA
eukprot:m.187890 g.187890  ORF g.187890 m.187890 type:complete len:666 (-) comp21634_c4_seq2:72-2069(-)